MLKQQVIIFSACKNNEKISLILKHEKQSINLIIINKSPMELDLDSFLQSQLTTDDDEDSDDNYQNTPHRTIDEILNDSNSSSSSSPPSSPSFNPTKSHEKPDNSRSKDDILFKDEIFLIPNPQTTSNDQISTIKEKHKSSNSVNLIRTSSIEPILSNEETPKSVVKSGKYLGNPYLSLGRSSSIGSSSSSSTLPQLFGGGGGVKLGNAKPGAALAAAAAASRSVSSHAAAIKSRRRAVSDAAAALQKIVHTEELDSGDVLTNVQFELDSKTEECSEKIDDTIITNVMEESVVGALLSTEEGIEISHESNESCYVKDTFEEQGKAAGLDKAELGTEESLKKKDSIVSEDTTSSSGANDNINADENIMVLSSMDNVEQFNKLSDESENAEELNVISTLPSSVSSYENPANEEKSNEEDSLLVRSEVSDLDQNEGGDTENGEVSLAVDDTSSKSEIMEVVEDKVGQLDSKKGGKKSGRKSRTSLKPLELAEELEKKHAYSGLHWEEGAAAQPMRLEGIRRGPPAVGYLHIDANNAITRTISSQAFRRDHGSPKVLAVHANFIAVGMSKGLILVVPCKYSAQNADKMDAKMLLLASQGHSPVTSMCFNQQGDLLLAGYGNGQIVLWDVQKVAMAKVITGEHTAPVVHTLFLGQYSQATRQFKAVTGDCKGLVLLHAFSIVPLVNHFSITTKCLLDGQKTGIVLSASPLIIEDSGSLTAATGNVSASHSGIGSMMGGVVGGSLFKEGSSLVEEGVVIFVTDQTALVVRFSPKLEVYAQLSRPDGVRDGFIPYTAWKCPQFSQNSSPEYMAGETSERASLLAIAWDQKVQVAKLVKSELKVYREWTLDSAAIGVAWLDDQMMVILTVRRQFCLYSKEGNELHRTSYPLDGLGADDFIAYHTYFSNVFGNPEKAYHNCLAVRGATIYVLGPVDLVVSRLLPWKERIQVLRKAGDWMGALDMAMRLYDGHAHGVIDLPRTLDAIREAIMSYLVDLILSYVDEVFSYISVAFCNQIGKEELEQKPETKRSSVQSEMEDQYARVGGVAVEFCVHVKRIDILFDEIFSKFVAVQHEGTFLELLEPYILKDMLGCLPPEIMQALVEHYSSKGWLQRVEQCVLHMDISSLDFNQVVRLCREHGLHGALIYLFNKGLDDFKAPLEELLLVLQNSKKENAAAIGYRMLVYLKYCFSGLAFPPGHGILPATRLPSLRRELLQFLLEDSDEMKSEVAASLKSRTGVCPNLFYLLHLDTESTLEVLKFAFLEEDSVSGHRLTDANLEDDNESGNNIEDFNLMVQNTVNTLITLLDTGLSGDDGTSDTSELEFKEIWSSKKDIGHLLEFIAYFVAHEKATITKKMLNLILKYLTSENSLFSSQKIDSSKRREKQMLTLLRVVPETDWNSSYVLHLCEKVHFYQVCSYVHTKRCQYVAALDSYMKDLDEPIHAFSFINSMLLQLRDAESVSFRSAVITRIPELFNLSREGAYLLIFDYFSKESEHILSELRSHPRSLFLYLKATIEVHLSGTLNFSSLEKCYALGLQNGIKLKDQSNEVELYLERMSDFPKLVRQNPVYLSDEDIELYLALLCQFERNSVLKFLQTFENYRLEHCLRLCQEYKVIDAAAFLLERVGDVGGAQLLTLSGLNEKFHMLNYAVEKIVADNSSSSYSEMQLFNSVLKIEEVTVVRETLHSSIGICQRNSKRLDPEESEFLWFQLLDSFCEPLRDPSDDKVVSKGNISGTLAATFDVKEESIDNWRIPKSHGVSHILRKLFAQFLKEIVEGMLSGYVHLPTIMTKLLSDNSSQVFGDFKLIILGMLGTYGFEKRILDTAKSLIEDDTFYTMSLLKKGASHGYAPQNLLCHICSSPLTKESSASGIRVFSCGHTTHLWCELQESESSNGYEGGCPVCVPKKNTRASRNKSVLNEDRLVEYSVSRSQQAQGNNTVQHPYESDLVEKPYAAPQISRFEMLNNLGKSQRSFQIESLPHLRLAPPAVYHEKVQKRTNVLAGESSSTSAKTEKSSRQLRELRMKKASLRFPSKSSIFGNDMARKR
ncbi:hypothetical protein IFM89_012551 [Coptis chinensis]|uniref:RING-type domain-containing protein n=1 Tax=Coptis chinensis TaxID=261450 RepID=A0A835HM19_9MAGN|nr:hypothetical protein IFM89_012551 [Coptis chinensis]